MAVAVAVAEAFTGAVAFTGAFAVAVAVAFFVAFTVGGADTRPGAFTFAVVLAGAVAVAGAVATLSALAIKHRLQGVFLSLYLPAMVLACFAAVAFLSPLKAWDLVGPLLLFLGLLTLLNAPFDWTSLGLTRALLRRGLELGGWWPYLLAIVDACIAGVIIALLALTMVVGVQAFDELAVHGRNPVTLKSISARAGIAPLCGEFFEVRWNLLAQSARRTSRSSSSRRIGGAWRQPACHAVEEGIQRQSCPAVGYPL